MTIRSDLEDWIISAINFHGGKASVTAISKYVWENYEPQIKAYGNALYTWQYDLRWAGEKLKDKGKLVKQRSGWEIVR
jgi:hypothetical protein